MSAIVSTHLRGILSFREQLLLFALLVCSIYCVDRLLFRPLWHSQVSQIPGPWLNKITNLYLAYYDLTCCRNDKILEWHRTYGPVVCIAPNEVSVATLEATREVYSTSNRWAKSNYFDNFIGFNERSIFAAKSYHEHREKRKLTSAFYQASNIHTTSEIEQRVRDRSQTLLSQIEAEVEVDVYSLTDHFALDNITYLVLGPRHCTQSLESPGAECIILEELKQLQFFGPFRARFSNLYRRLAYLLKSISPKYDYLYAEHKLADWCRGRIVAASSEDPAIGPHSLLQRLLQYTDTEDVRTLSDDYVAAEIMDNINAAEATVAVTATYLIWRLSENPVWQQRLREELYLLPRQTDGSVSYNDINQGPILEACLREVYRLHPASSGRAERVVPKGGCTLSAVYLPEGAIVSTSVVALHRDEAYFPDPNQFLPERWLEGDELTLKERDAHLIPFGYGGRICLGKALATMEIKLLMADLYLRYESHSTLSSTAASMKQCSTHDAVPKALKCMIIFRRALRGD